MTSSPNQHADAVREDQECWFCPRPIGDPTKAKVYMVRKMRDTFAVLVHPECYPEHSDGSQGEGGEG